MLILRNVVYQVLINQAAFISLKETFCLSSKMFLRMKKIHNRPVEDVSDINCAYYMYMLMNQLGLQLESF